MKTVKELYEYTLNYKNHTLSFSEIEERYKNNLSDKNYQYAIIDLVTYIDFVDNTKSSVETFSQLTMLKENLGENLAKKMEEHIFLIYTLTNQKNDYNIRNQFDRCLLKAYLIADNEIGCGERIPEKNHQIFFGDFDDCVEFYQQV